MVKNSVAKRLKITKQGKVLHRTPGLGHSRSNKRRIQILRKKGKRKLSKTESEARQLLNF